MINVSNKPCQWLNLVDIFCACSRAKWMKWVCTHLIASGGILIDLKSNPLTLPNISAS